MSNVAVSQKMQTFKTLFQNAGPSIRDVLPKHLTPERMIKVALVAISRNPRLMQCTPESMLGAMMTASELGLEPSGVLGMAYLVPYKNNKTNKMEAQFQVGYQGLIDLARRSGSVLGVEAHCVYENDMFEVEYGLEPKLVHKPLLTGKPGKLVAVYAVAKIRDSDPQVEVMTLEQVEGIRKRSKAKDNGPWKTDYDEMARKTVVKRLIKYVPKSTELTRAIQHDDAVEFDPNRPITVMPEIDTETGTPEYTAEEALIGEITELAIDLDYPEEEMNKAIEVAQKAGGTALLDLKESFAKRLAEQPKQENLV